MTTNSPAPMFSVVIPAYNAPLLVLAAIDSVLGQTLSDLELIVVDDGSTDDTADRISDRFDDPRLILIRQQNTGTAGARNRGIESARGEFVSFLDNDDLWMPTYLERMQAANQTRPDAGLLYTDGWSLDDRVGRVRRRTAMAYADPPANPPSDPNTFLEILVEGNFIAPSATVRRADLVSVGGFSQDVGGVDDYDLWLRLLASGVSAARAAGLQVIQRDRSGSQSKDIEMMRRGLRSTLERLVESGAGSPAVHAAARRRIAGIDADLAPHRVWSPTGVQRGAKRLALALRRVVVGNRVYLSDDPPDVRAAMRRAAEVTGATST